MLTLLTTIQIIIIMRSRIEMVRYSLLLTQQWAIIAEIPLVAIAEMP